MRESDSSRSSHARGGCVALGLVDVCLGNLDVGEIRRSRMFSGIPAPGRVGESLGGVGDRLCRPAASPRRRVRQSGSTLTKSVLGGAHVALRFVEWLKEWIGAALDVIERPASGGELLLRRPSVAANPARAGELGGQMPALGDGRCVGSIVGEDLFEDVAGLLGFVGHDEQAVLLPSAGGADVEASVAGRGGDDGDPDVDGVALVAVGGGGVAEPDVSP